MKRSPRDEFLRAFRLAGIEAYDKIEPPEDLEDEPEDDEEPSTRARELEATKTRKGTKGTSNVSSSARAILDRTRRARAEVEDATA